MGPGRTGVLSAGGHGGAGRGVNRGPSTASMPSPPSRWWSPVSFALVGGLARSQRRENPIGGSSCSWRSIGAGGRPTVALFAAITHPASCPPSWALWWFNWSEILVYPVGPWPSCCSCYPTGTSFAKVAAVAAASVTVTLLLAAIDGVDPGPLSGPNDNPPACKSDGPASHPGISGGRYPEHSPSWSGWRFYLVAAAAPLVRGGGPTATRGNSCAGSRTCADHSSSQPPGGRRLRRRAVLQVPWELTVVTWLGCRGAAGRRRRRDLQVPPVRHRTYHRRTLVYGSLAAFITAVYVAVAWRR